jgi:hypothetical protein
LDTSELEKAIKDLEIEKTKRKKAEIFASEMKLQYELVNDELQVLRMKYKSMLEQQKQQADHYNLKAATTNGSVTGSLLYNLEKEINITEALNCFVKTFTIISLASNYL